MPTLTDTETVQLVHSHLSPPPPDLFPFGHPAQWYFLAGAGDEVEAQGFQQSQPAGTPPHKASTSAPALPLPLRSAARTAAIILMQLLFYLYDNMCFLIAGNTVFLNVNIIFNYITEEVAGLHAEKFSSKMEF